jgi:hypothetical protein
MEKNILKTENGTLFKKIEEQLVDLVVNLIIIISFLFIIMR